MEIVKKNIISIICGVVALIAVVMVFWPIGGWFEDLQARAKKHADVAGEAESLKKLPRVLPIVPGAATDKPTPLTRFPDKATIEVGSKAIEQLGTQSVKALNFVVALNQRGHDLLVPGSLPNPPQQQLFAFRTQYQAAMTPGGKPTAYGPTAPENIWDNILQSAPPPTIEEMRTALEKLFDDKYKPMIVTMKKDPPPGSPAGTEPTVTEYNRAEVVKLFQTKEADFDERFKRERATKFKMYADVDALTIASGMGPSDTPTPESIWYAQMTYWVQADIARSIRDMNLDNKAGGVRYSRVKHLINIDMKTDFTMYQMGAAATNALAAPGMPGQAAAAPVVVEVPPKSWVTSHTGRISNPMYDVVHSTVLAVVDEKSVEAFVKMLQRGQMVTVLDVKQGKVDLKAAEDVGFAYGSPSVKLTLTLEHLFLREWTANGANSPMPKDVKAKLGWQQPAPAEGGVAPVASSR